MGGATAPRAPPTINNHLPLQDIGPQDAGNVTDPVRKYTWGGLHKVHEDFQKRFRKMLEKNKAVFCYELKDMAGYVGAGGESFLLNWNQPFPEKLIKSYHHAAAMLILIGNKKSQQLLDAGFIEPAAPKGQYASCLTMPAKKDEHGNYLDRRFRIDFRHLNAKTVPDYYGLHLHKEIRARMSSAKYFTKLDHKASFMQAVVKETEKSKTAFWLGNQLYQYKRKPFRLKNASVFFQHIMDLELIAGGQCPQADV